MTSSRIARVAAPLAGLAILTSACGGTTASGGHDQPGPDGSACPSGAASCLDAGRDAPGAEDTGSGGDGASAMEGGAGLCSVDPGGPMFVFHIHNGGSQKLGLSFGCGGMAPIVLTTPGGMQTIAPAFADFCGFTCDEVNAGKAQGGACSDCGPGNGAPLAPGMTYDQSWARRTFAAGMSEQQCTGGVSEPCAQGTHVAPAAVQAGTLTVCVGGSTCTVMGGASEMVAFTVDTTQGEGTIEVQ